MNRRILVTALLAGTAALSACKKEPPASLPPEPQPTMTSTPGDNMGGGIAQPGSQAHFEQGVNGQNVSQMKFLHAWVVNTATGESRDDVLKRTPMFVRLVRKSIEP